MDEDRLARRSAWNAALDWASARRLLGHDVHHMSDVGFNSYMNGIENPEPLKETVTSANINSGLVGTASVEPLQLSMGSIPEELIEKTARRICLTLNLNPNDKVGSKAHTPGMDVYWLVERWLNYREQAIAGLAAIWEVEQARLDKEYQR